MGGTSRYWTLLTNSLFRYYPVHIRREEIQFCLITLTKASWLYFVINTIVLFHWCSLPCSPSKVPRRHVTAPQIYLTTSFLQTHKRSMLVKEYGEENPEKSKLKKPLRTLTTRFSGPLKKKTTTTPTGLDSGCQLLAMKYFFWEGEYFFCISFTSLT